MALLNPKAHISFLCNLFMALVLISCPATSSSDEFNYDPRSQKGPAHWGDIRPEWNMCKNGTMQSPIDLNDRRVQLTSRLSKLYTKYRPSNATLKNSGHDIRVEWPGDAGYVLMNGTRYLLQQCHWHSPSEHTINGIRLPLELHMVHKSEAGRIAVIGMLYRMGQPDPLLQTVADDLKFFSEQNKQAEKAMGVVHPEQIMKINKKLYYRYIGSLTTPPCDENVVWTIVRQVKSVSMEQVRLLRVAVHDEYYINARPLQAINARLVQLHIQNLPKEH